MGKVDLAAELAKENPKARPVDLRVYADALQTYREAAENIDRCGAIVQHPRTGQPMENPYLKIRTAAGATLTKMRHIRCQSLLALLDKQATK